LPLPEDIPLFFAGVFSQQGHMSLAMACIFAWCGIIGGDCMLYTLGRKFGPDIVHVPVIGGHISLTRMAKVEHWFNRWGVLVVAIGRMFAGIRGAMVVVAGATKFNFFKFIVADGLAAVFSGGLFVFLGYKFGEHGQELKEKFKGGIFIGAVALVAAIVAFVLWRKWLRRFRTTQESPSVNQADPTAP